MIERYKGSRLFLKGMSLLLAVGIVVCVSPSVEAEDTYPNELLENNPVSDIGINESEDISDIGGYTIEEVQDESDGRNVQSSSGIEKFDDLSALISDEPDAADELADSNDIVSIDGMDYPSNDCGKIADKVFWELDENGNLTIYGEGAMMDWERPEDVPWFPYSDQIRQVNVLDGVTHIGAYAFSSCNYLRTGKVG